MHAVDMTAQLITCTLQDSISPNCIYGPVKHMVNFQMHFTQYCAANKHANNFYIIHTISIHNTCHASACQQYIQ